MNDDNFNDAICENTSRIAKAKEWSDIDWKTAYKYVNRLQIRIVKATKRRNWNLVKRLQYLLTNSFYAKALAVKKVTSNRGKNTPGVDNEIWNSDVKKWNAIKKFNLADYKALPTKRVHIPKSNGKKRPLSIPTMKDRAVQTLFLFALQPIEETTADEHSYGFRLHRGCHDACEQIFADLSLKNSAQWVLEGDIKGCFDNISHKWMLNNIHMEQRILKQFIKAGYLFQNKLFPTNRGAVQGGAISPTLANLVLDGLEERIWERINIGKSGKVVKLKNLHKVHLIRYTDDFVITGESKEILEQVKVIVIEFMNERGLQLSKKKTFITNVNDGFDFLGWNFRKYNNKLIIKPSKKSIKRFSENLSDTVKHLLPAEQGLLIIKLNQKLRGWCNYHSTVCAKDTFKTVDFILFKKLLWWMKRKHSNKRVQHFYAKYWKTIGKRRNIFTDGSWILVNCSYTPIVRHPKLKSGMNPYINTEYFDKRIESIKEIKRKAKKRVAAVNPAYA